MHNTIGMASFIVLRPLLLFVDELFSPHGPVKSIALMQGRGGGKVTRTMISIFFLQIYFVLWLFYILCLCNVVCVSLMCEIQTLQRFAFVNMATARDADEAVRRLNGTRFHGISLGCSLKDQPSRNAGGGGGGGHDRDRSPRRGSSPRRGGSRERRDRSPRRGSSRERRSSRDRR